MIFCPKVVCTRLWVVSLWYEPWSLAYWINVFQFITYYIFIVYFLKIATTNSRLSCPTNKQLKEGKLFCKKCLFLFPLYCINHSCSTKKSTNSYCSKPLLLALIVTRNFWPSLLKLPLCKCLCLLNTKEARKC